GSGDRRRPTTKALSHRFSGAPLASTRCRARTRSGHVSCDDCAIWRKRVLSSNVCKQVTPQLTSSHQRSKKTPRHTKFSWRETRVTLCCRPRSHRLEHRSSALLSAGESNVSRTAIEAARRKTPTTHLHGWAAHR